MEATTASLASPHQCQWWATGWGAGRPAPLSALGFWN